MKLYLKEKLYKCKNYKCRKAISPLKGTIFTVGEKTVHVFCIFTYFYRAFDPKWIYGYEKLSLECLSKVLSRQYIH
jgi:hypothetical protein